MSIGTLLYSKLTSDSGVSALVSARVYAVILPNNAKKRSLLPAISYQRISNTEQNGTSTLRETRYQVDCWDDGYEGVQALADAVKSALEEWADTDQSPSVKMCRVIGELDDYEADTGLYRDSIDVMCTTMGD